MTSFIGYYGLGLPSALYLGFSLKMGLNGFWLSYSVAMLGVDIIVSYIVITSKWEAKYVFEPKSAASRER